MDKLIQDYLNSPIDSIDLVRPMSQEGLNSMKAFFEETRLEYVNKVVELSRKNKLAAQTWGVITHDLSNQFNQPSGALELAYYGIADRNNVPMLEVLRNELIALRNLIKIIDLEHASPYSEFSLGDLIDSIYIPGCEIELIGDINTEIDISILFTVRTLILNSKGKSGRKYPETVKVEITNDECNLTFRVYDDCSPVWMSGDLGSWTDSYKMGWAASNEISQSTNSGGSIVAYLAGQRARKNRLGINRDEGGYFVHVNAENSPTALKYVQITFPASKSEA